MDREYETTGDCFSQQKWIMQSSTERDQQARVYPDPFPAGYGLAYWWDARGLTIRPEKIENQHTLPPGAVFLVPVVTTAATEAPKPEPDAAVGGLEAKTDAELQQLAAERGITPDPKWSKAYLISKIRGAKKK